MLHTYLNQHSRWDLEGDTFSLWCIADDVGLLSTIDSIHSHVYFVQSGTIEPHLIFDNTDIGPILKKAVTELKLLAETEGVEQAQFALDLLKLNTL